MTVSTTTSFQQFVTDGVTVAYNVGFEVLEIGDIVVKWKPQEVLPESEVTLVPNSDYTITQIGDGENGFILTTNSALEPGILSVRRQIDAIQPVDYNTYDSFPEEAHEAGLDRNCLVAQDSRNNFERAIKFRDTEDRTSPGKHSYLPSPVQENVIGWDEDGNLKNIGVTDAIYAQVAVADEGSVVEAGTTRINFVGDGVRAFKEAGDGSGDITVEVSKDAFLVGDAGVKITVGAGGDFATLTEALREAAKYFNGPSVSSVPEVNVELQSGFVIDEKISFYGVDLRGVRITGVDASHQVDVDSITGTVFWIERSFAPVFDLNLGFVGATGSVLGFNVVDASTLVFANGRVIQADPARLSTGISAIDSTIIGQNLTITTAASDAIKAVNSYVSLPYGRLDGNSTGATLIASVAYMDFVDASGSGSGTGISASASRVSLYDGNADNRATGILATDSSEVNARSFTATSCGTGLRVIDATVFAEQADLSSCSAFGIEATDGARVTAGLANIGSISGGTAIRAVYGSSVNANLADLSNSSVAVEAGSGSRINADQANMSLVATIGVHCWGGSHVVAGNCNASSAATIGFSVTQGSTIAAAGATGTLSQAANTVTANGIIFQ